MTFRWGTRSAALLAQVHPHLQELMQAVIAETEQDLTILPSTVRTIKEQHGFLTSGTSWTWNSRHLHGLAVDVAPYPGIWKSTRMQWREMCDLIERKAAELGYPVTMGRTFKTVDMPHVELSKAAYPDKPEVLAAIREYRESLE